MQGGRAPSVYLEHLGTARSEYLEHGPRGHRCVQLKEELVEEVKSLLNRHKIAKKGRKKSNLAQKSILEENVSF